MNTTALHISQVSKCPPIHAVALCESPIAIQRVRRTDKSQLRNYVVATANKDMDKAKSQADEPSRRRSMLPRKTSVKLFSKQVASFPEQDSHKAGRQCAEFGESQASALSQGTQNNAISMLPPSKLMPDAGMQPPASLGRTSKRNSAESGHLPRQLPASRRSSRVNSANGVSLSQNTVKELSEPHIQIRTSSGGPAPLSHAKRFNNGRCLSQQVTPTAASEFSSSKALSQGPSSLKYSRPAFSSMQQHLNPKKSSLTNLSSLSSQPANKDEIPSADVFHLQMDLAQLHLLHRTAFSVQAQWEESAERSYEHRFNALYERHTELKEIAHQQQTLINQLALVQWSQGKSSAQIAEKVQLLSHNISDVCNLLVSEGKYTSILEIFESWFGQALRLRGQRESIGRRFGIDLDLIEGIGDGWKAEAMVLERELTYSARDLESFGEVQSTSGLGRILLLYRKLMVGLLEELDLIQSIENGIMTQETAGMESTIHNLESNVTEDINPMDPDRKAIYYYKKQY